MSNERAKQIVGELLGKVFWLPMIFDGNSLCPNCLWLAMNIIGGLWVCEHCGFWCVATVVLDSQGEKWLKIQEAIGK